MQKKCKIFGHPRSSRKCETCKTAETCRNRLLEKIKKSVKIFSIKKFERHPAHKEINFNLWKIDYEITDNAKTKISEIYKKYADNKSECKIGTINGIIHLPTEHLNAFALELTQILQDLNNLKPL